MKRKVLAALILVVTMTGIAGNAWSRVVVVPRRRVVVRPRPLYIYPRRRVVYYRSPCKKVVYLPPSSAPHYYRYDPRYEGVEEVEIDVDIEIDD